VLFDGILEDGIFKNIFSLPSPSTFFQQYNKIIDSLFRVHSIGSAKIFVHSRGFTFLLGLRAGTED